MRVSVDAAQLRQSAADLDDAPEPPRTVTVGMGDLGSSRADKAFEQYYATWTSECTVAERNVERLAAALRSAADTYERRDAEAAATLRGGPVAF